jgi:acetate kinase
MAIALVFNPGSNSLKFELLELDERQHTASQATKLASAALDDIGKDTKLSVYRGREIVSERDTDVADMQSAVRAALGWIREQDELSHKLKQLTFTAVRVVHGGSKYKSTVRVTENVRSDIAELEELAPLHNKSSLDILDVLAEKLSGIPAFATFDTVFHHTLPEKAWRYPIERETADRHGIRKFGFHGVSHRYMLEHYAYTIGKRPDELSLITLHLESGSSACAIASGRSVDTTMGFTPLEGVMMGSRSGSIDPAIVPYLMQKESKSGEEILTLLNKRSGLRGIAGGSLDTRELVKRSDPEAKLALEMFSYRVRLAVGAYLAALGTAEAILFGGGIGEDSPWLREEVCAGLGGWGLELDHTANRSIAGMVRISTESSRLQAWAIPAEEGLQIAHECMLALIKG